MLMLSTVITIVGNMLILVIGTWLVVYYLVYNVNEK